MQPRTQQQIYDSLGSIYDPQEQLIKQQQAAIPGQIASQEQGLQAKQTEAFDSIMNGARSRGLGFGGIPLQDQAKYTASTYLPALADLRTAGVNQQTSLADAINKIHEARYNNSVAQYQDERNFAEQQRMNSASIANEQAKLRASSANPTIDPSLQAYINSLTQGPKTGSATATKRADGGFNYVDANGKPISAAMYAVATGHNIRDVLAEAAKQGDKGAQTALGFVGSDGGYDPRKITNKSLADLYNSLFWDTGKKATYKAPINAGAIANGLSNYAGLVNPMIPSMGAINRVTSLVRR